MAEIVGSPLRAAFGDFNRDEMRMSARERYGVGRDGVVLGVVGGSLGAGALNTIARSLASDDSP
jgi:UDP-N-acetylglucosamine:LPS N-acetylglucosamine transferase